MGSFFLGNSVINYITVFIIFFLVYNLIIFLKSNIIKKLQKLSEKTETKIDDVVFNILSKIGTLEYLIISFYISIRFLKVVHTKILLISKIAFLTIILYRVILIIDGLTAIFFENIITTSKESEKSIRVIRNIIKIAIWIFAILFLLHNIGLNINSILTGLGIGGVAIALASQTILKDIFNFFVILLDKPFKTGDFIIIPSSNISGVVEEIGLKSTKIRTLQGEVVIITNSKISEEIIQNFSKMIERRVLVKIGVTYQTPLEKLNKINHIIERAIKKQSNTRFDRANFIRFGDFSLEFEFVYYILSQNYKDFVDTNEKILLEIAQEFKKEEIDFAYPTQTIHLKKEGE